jgi:HK97 family phage portal protein
MSNRFTNAVRALFGSQVKISATAPYIMLQFTGQSEGVATRRNFAQYAEEAYRKNVVAYRAISVVARGAAFIPLKVKIGERDAQPTHPLVRLLRRPNPWQGGASFIESVVAYYLLSGNTYIEGVGPDNAPPRELYSLRPDRMRVIPGAVGVAGYLYEVNGQKKRWAADPVTGLSPILHLKSFNPLDDIYGMSAVEAAAYSVDQHNEAGKWNQSLLQNSARPSGAMVYSGTSSMTDKQFERMKQEINEKMSGGSNAGRPIILEGGLDWKQMSLTPAEMDWINGKHVSAREIALAFGVAPQLLGIPGDSTYSNYQEARQSL